MKKVGMPENEVWNWRGSAGVSADGASAFFPFAPAPGSAEVPPEPPCVVLFGARGLRC